jgi:hypothetical protein
MALGYTGRKEVVTELRRLADKLTPESEFSHVRAMAIAAENLKSEALAASLSALLHKDGMTGYHIADQLEAVDKLTLNIVDRVYILEDSLRNSALKELYIAKALYLCGDKDGAGREILENYASGLEGHYARFASEVLGK